MNLNACCSPLRQAFQLLRAASKKTPSGQDDLFGAPKAEPDRDRVGTRARPPKATEPEATVERKYIPTSAEGHLTHLKELLKQKVLYLVNDPYRVWQVQKRLDADLAAGEHLAIPAALQAEMRVVRGQIHQDSAKIYHAARSRPRRGA